MKYNLQFLYDRCYSCIYFNFFLQLLIHISNRVRFIWRHLSGHLATVISIMGLLFCSVLVSSNLSRLALLTLIWFTCCLCLCGVKGVYQRVFLGNNIWGTAGCSETRSKKFIYLILCWYKTNVICEAWKRFSVSSITQHTSNFSNLHLSKPSHTWDLLSRRRTDGTFPHKSAEIPNKNLRPHITSSLCGITLSSSRFLYFSSLNITDFISDWHFLGRA